MAKYLYLLTFDRDENTNYDVIHDYIKSDTNYIIDWWHYLQSSYILLSEYSGVVLADKILRNFPNHRFLLIEVNPRDYQGWLPSNAWSWLKKYKP